MKKVNVSQFLRRIRWFFGKSGVVSLGLEHFLAMVPATILVPLLVNNTLGENVIDMSLVLFASGFGTMVFTLISKGKIPAYLGSSFAYIGLTLYLIDSEVGAGATPQMAYSYIGWAYIFSGILLAVLSFLYKKNNIERFLSFILPASVVGPAISLIGLELSDTAVSDSGFDVVNGMVDSKSALVAIVTLFVIVLLSLLKRRVMKNAAIFVGVIIGYIVSLFVNGVPDLNLSFKDVFAFSVPKINLPLLTFPKNWLNLFIAVIPSTFVIFTENLGRVTVIDRMVNNSDSESSIYNTGTVKQLHKGLFSHGISTIAVALIGSVPNTVYAENIAVMGIHSSSKKKDPDKVISTFTDPFSIYPYLVAAALAILFSFAGILQSILLAIPKAVIGGMELFLFGIISAPGIQLLVDQKVNYKKISNQIITASVLISGISGLSVDFGVVELKGMSLGFVVGVLLNLLVQLLKWIGNTSDEISFDEVMEKCLGAIINQENLDKDSHNIKFIVEGKTVHAMRAVHLYQAFKDSKSSILIGDSGQRSTEWALDAAKHASDTEFYDNEKKLFTLSRTANSFIIDINKRFVDEDTREMYLNDYPAAIDADSEELHIDLTKEIPMRKVLELLKIASNIKITE